MVLSFAEQYCFGSRCLPFVMNLKRILTAGVDFIVFLTSFCFSKFSFVTYPSHSVLSQLRLNLKVQLAVSEQIHSSDISRNRGHSLVRNHISCARTADRERKKFTRICMDIEGKRRYLS